MRLALCTLAVPWPDRPTLGGFSVAQMRAMQRLGHDVQIFTVAPVLPPGAAAISERAARQARRPALYQAEGVPICTCRGPFAFPPTVRRGLAGRAPSLVSQWLRHAAGSPLARELDAFGPDALLIHGAMPWGNFARWYAGSRRVPFGIIEHSYDDVMRLDVDSQLVRWYLSTAAAARFVALVGSHMCEHVSAIGVPRTTVIANGATRPTVAQRRRPRPTERGDDTVILVAGQYYSRKGHAVLLEAFARAAIGSTRLVMVGPPPSPVRRLITTLGLDDRVTILPFLEQRELLQEMIWADVFALPSWNEAFGLVYVEAMACGTPPIMTSDAGVAAAIEPGVHGWVVPPRDVDALASTLSEAVHCPSLDAMGRAGRRLVSERFTWRANARRLVELFHDAVSAPVSTTALAAGTPRGRRVFV